jgi:flagellar hook assembly protein FlgD
VRLTIYNVVGEIVRKMELGHLTAGSYSQTEKAIYWDGKTESGEQMGSGRMHCTWYS